MPRLSLASRKGDRGQRCAIALLLVSGLLQGCATPLERADAFATSQHYSRSVVRGAEFRHVVFGNDRHDDSRALHVYLEGDGSPYLDRRTVAADPTPRDTVMLHLMALDPSPAVYVGRPCYFGLATDPPCSPVDWTLGRFSERVVASLARVIESLQQHGGYRALELYGHSGGGALAVLLGRRMSGVRRVVTLAGNLDPDAWARYHDYTPLSLSLNPVQLGALPASVQQLHVAAAEDTSVPAWLVQSAAPKLGDGRVVVLADANHTCCWAEHWPALLAGP